MTPLWFQLIFPPTVWIQLNLLTKQIENAGQTKQDVAHVPLIRYWKSTLHWWGGPTTRCQTVGLKDLNSNCPLQLNASSSRWLHGRSFHRGSWRNYESRGLQPSACELQIPCCCCYSSPCLLFKYKKPHQLSSAHEPSVLCCGGDCCHAWDWYGCTALFHPALLWVCCDSTVIINRRHMLACLSLS